MKDIRFAYYSKPSKEFRCTGIESILTAARKNNDRLDVTGLLVQTPTHFMQVLEGRREAVSQILARIMADPRHSDVTLYGAMEIDCRWFAQQQMGFVGAAEFTEELCIDLFGMKTVLPSLLTYDAAMSLFKRVAEDADLSLRSEAALEDLRRDDFFEISV